MHTYPTHQPFIRQLPGITYGRTFSILRLISLPLYLGSVIETALVGFLTHRARLSGALARICFVLFDNLVLVEAMNLRGAWVTGHVCVTVASKN